MLVTLKEILSYAEANKCAIGAFHILSETDREEVYEDLYRWMEKRI